MAHDDVGLVVSGPDQVILESHPPHRLAYTWHTITPEWAAAVGMDEATAAAWRAEARSKVAFDIEDVGHGAVKLTVTHDGFAPGSAVLPAISEGWPASWPASRPCLRQGHPCAPRERPGAAQAGLHRSWPVVALGLSCHPGRTRFSRRARSARLKSKFQMQRLAEPICYLVHCCLRYIAGGIAAEQSEDAQTAQVSLKAGLAGMMWK